MINQHTESVWFQLKRIADALEGLAGAWATAPARLVDTSPAPGASKFAERLDHHPDTVEVLKKWRLNKSKDVHPSFEQKVSDCLKGGAVLDDVWKAMRRKDCLPSLPPWEFVALIEQEKRVREY